MSVNKELQDLKVEVAEFKAGINEWMATTTEYRKALCTKLDTLNNRFTELPCRERKGWYTSMGKQVAFMWGLLCTGCVFLLKHLMIDK
jgi:hypothetical protein